MKFEVRKQQGKTQLRQQLNFGMSVDFILAHQNII